MPFASINSTNPRTNRLSWSIQLIGIVDTFLMDVYVFFSVIPVRSRSGGGPFGGYNGGGGDGGGDGGGGGGGGDGGGGGG